MDVAFAGTWKKRLSKGCFNRLLGTLYAQSNRSYRLTTYKGEPNSKKTKTIPFAVKVMATVYFSNLCGVNFIDYLRKVEIISIEYSGDVLHFLNYAIKNKWLHLSKQKVLLHQDNVSLSSYTSVADMAKIKELNFELLSHQPSFFFLTSKHSLVEQHLLITIKSGMLKMDALRASPSLIISLP